MSTDHYLALAAPAEFRHKIERSEFLGLVFPVTSDEAFFEELARVTKRHFDATHHCWAFRIFGGEAGARQRSSDAGEPSGTAGRPILAALEGAALFDVGAIVVRWYGGIKLGTGGLSRAYRETTAEAVRIATIADRYLYEPFALTVPFDMLGAVYRLVRPPDVVLTGEHFAETNVFDLDVRRSLGDAFAQELTAKRFAFTRESAEAR